MSRAEESLTPDYKASIEFLQRWCPEGRWVTTSIHPDKKNQLVTRTFEAEDYADCEAWLKEQGDLGKNLYFQVNPLRVVINGKGLRPSREDVAQFVALHVDVDPPDPPKELLAPDRRADLDAYYAGERERILGMLREPPSGIPPPTCINFSGGGLQAFWRLELPRTLDGTPADYEDAALYNKRLEQAFGADHCHSIEHLMRLPGTCNRPNKKKREEKGRVPALAAQVEWHADRLYGIGEFEKAAPKGSGMSKPAAPGAPVRRYKKTSQIPRIGRSKKYEMLRTVIEKGLDPEDPDRHPSKSEWQNFACCEMVRAGCGDDVILSIITDPNWPISATVFEHGGDGDYAQRQVNRAHEQVEGEFAKNQYGLPVQNLRNRRLAFRKLGLTFRYNELTREVEVCGLRGRSTTLMLGDNEAADIRGDMELQFGLSSSKDDLFHAAG